MVKTYLFLFNVLNQIRMCWWPKTTQNILFSVAKMISQALADPGGGAHPARATPPNGRGPMIFFMP